MTASPSTTWSPTTASTTRPTASPTATGPTTTGRGTAGPRAPPTTPASWPCGDEFGRTQQGNNNAYCQDNEISWFDWSRADPGLLGFTRRLIAFRKEHPVFRRRRFLTGADRSELDWFTPAGTAMTDADWADGSALAIAIYLDGSDAPDRARDGTPLTDDDFLLLVNAWWEPLAFTIPVCRASQGAPAWQPEIDTYEPAGPGEAAALHPGDQLTVGPRSIVVCRAPRLGALLLAGS